MAFQQVEGAYVIQSARMVLVAVGQQDGIQVAHILAQHLLTEIRSGIDQDGQALVFYQGAGTQAFVAAVSGAANLTLAANHRDTLRSSRS